jgi:hypothetical protein
MAQRAPGALRPLGACYAARDVRQGIPMGETTEHVSVRLDTALLTRIDALGAATRTAAIETLLGDALDHREGQRDRLDRIAAAGGVSRIEAEAGLERHPLAVLALVLADAHVPSAALVANAQQRRLRSLVAEVEACAAQLRTALQQHDNRVASAPAREAAARQAAVVEMAQRHETLRILLGKLRPGASAEAIAEAGEVARLSGARFNSELAAHAREVIQLAADLAAAGVTDVAALVAAHALAAPVVRTVSTPESRARRDAIRARLNRKEKP